MSRAASRRAVEAVWRIDSARLVGSLARSLGDFSLAEDAAQDALAEALVVWPRTGIPDNPGGWLTTVARRRAIDSRRAQSSREARELAVGGATVRDARAHDDDALWDPDTVDDNVLALILIACHPVVPPDGRIALTLRTVGGLTSEEIAAAFLVPVPTIQARITRAKKALAAAKVPFEVPNGAARDERLASVLHVIYLIFTEGSSATGGDDVIRPDLAHEALRLARLVVQLAPIAEAYGLLALLELTAARFPARVDRAGRPVLLDAQDRRRWDFSAITRGRAALRLAVGTNGLGPYGLQASIAECHDIAASVDTTDWDRIVVLYDALVTITDSPVVRLNHAVAVSMATGPDTALDLVDELSAAGSLSRYHPLHVTRGELLLRLDRGSEARGEFLRAAELCTNRPERDLLIRKADAAIHPG